MACRSSQRRWRRFLSSAKGRTRSPRRVKRGHEDPPNAPSLVSLRPLGHGRERVGEELPLPLHPVLGQDLRRPRRRGHLPHPRYRPLRAVVEEVAALGQQGVGAYAESSRPPAPRSSRRGPVSLGIFGGVGLPALLLHGTPPQLLQEADAFLPEVRGSRPAGLQDRLRLRQALLRMPIFGRALEDQCGFKLLLYPVHILLEPVRALVCHASPLLPRRLHRESSRPRGLELAVSIHPQANTSVCGLKAGSPSWTSSTRRIEDR